MSHSTRALKNKHQNYSKENFQHYISNPGEPDDYVKYDYDGEDTGTLLRKADRYYWVTKREIKLTAQKLRLKYS